MKRFYLLLAVVIAGCICFSIGVSAHAAVGVPSFYETYSWASYGINEDGGPGYTHAVVSGNEAHDIWLAESRVNDWELGARADLRFDYESMQVYRPNAWAEFKQQFLVTDGSVASTVTFAYDGALSAAGDNVDWDNSWYWFGVSLSVDHCDGDGAWVENKHWEDFYKAESDGFGAWDYDNVFTVTYAAGQLTTGETFFLDVCLWAFYEAEGVSFLGEFLGYDDGEPIYGDPTSGYLDISADFYNSLRLVSLEGGIAAVPIPSAVLLLGSGLIGLVGIGRKFSKKPVEWSSR